ncbi:unnamed protein product [Ranitomeya imitator]|uniref:Uncharacterized protein n=1 Tax=Ranitomeya imitator TaxID=111125 RepID=A0ABN9MS55_9NEOB|nr:unnamed protein product [Ranitomeya imitator]
MAAKSVKKDKCLPGVALDVLRIAVKEKAFELFWNEVVELGLMEEDNAPCIYLCYRLLGAALPLLDKNQLQMILHGNVMLRYGEHVVSTQDSDPESDGPLDLESPGYQSTIDSLIEAVNQSIQVDEESATSSTQNSVSFKRTKRTHRLFDNHPEFQGIVQRHREHPDKHFQGQRSLESK